MILRKFTSSILSAALLLTSAGTLAVNPVSAASDERPNYAEALQKSLYFYECQQAGPLPEWNRVEWRDDSTMTDEIKGGWYDAGDHAKFNLPMAYSASMLAWGLYQYPNGIEKCGEMTNYVNNLKFVLDYLAECDRVDEVVFQVGIGQKDHTWWGPVELYEYGMVDQGNSPEDARAYLSSSEGCSAVFGEMAAALAAGYCALDGRIDQTVLDGYLKHAKNIFKLADNSKSDDYYNSTDASGFYRSSHFYDELFYAANWLYIATGDQTYLDKATGYIPYLSKELGSDELCYSSGQCWDDNMQGGMLLYAINTQDPFYISRVKKHVDYWTNSVKKLDGGMRWLATWGCLRYAEAAGFIASVACDTILSGNDYIKFYEEQINFALGVNPNNQSYVVGFGPNAPKNPHHRTSHASWKNDLAYPDTNRHILYGALVGGPTEAGAYEDDRQNYINNEVADDYNAGFTALLCKMVEKYGGETDPNFPQPEQHDSPEFYVEAQIKRSSASGVDLSLKITNHSAWPARIQDNISYRYYMDLSEIIDAGYSADDVVIRCDRDQAAMYSGEGVDPVEISKPIHYKDSIYYIEVTYPDGRAAMPISEGRNQCELMLALVFPNYGSGWNAENDYSNSDIISNAGSESTDGVMSEYIPVYINGTLYYGKEPDGTSADGGMTPQDPTVPSSEPTKPSDEPSKPIGSTGENSSGEVIVWGDADLSGKVEISDAAKIMSYVANPDKYSIKDDALTLCDVYQRGDGINNMDALAVRKCLAQIITELPESIMS